jgi:DNA helicase-2/ATP-dependent DNA helicase PcrA
MSIYDTLNPMQREAVYTTEGPLLVLAGAGSGKTRALTHRIAYLIEEKGVNPWNILAITFTNKAAKEMRNRVDQLVEYGAESIWVATFHSTCVRILRRHIELLGFDKNFSIYDGDDQKTLIKQVMKTLDVDPKLYKERTVMKQISDAKDNLISPDQFYKEAAGDFRKMKIGEIYQEYQSQLQKNNAVDFDDLIVKTVELFQTHPEVLEYYQERFRYIMVDEYQDTNNAQFALIYLLANKYQNLCVVGDDDQSIYKFRGANIQNILNFEEKFQNTHVVKLEQNYRSTKNILDVANEVIRHNTGRKDKRLWTDNEEGKKIQLKVYPTARDEAENIALELMAMKTRGFEYKDAAVLYRTNAQSRLIEERLVNKNIPYHLVGGVNFYQRKEIKDVLAYLKTIENGLDDLAAQRIINVPKRGIGAVTIGKIVDFARENGLSFYAAMKEYEVIPSLGRATDKIRDFVTQIQMYRTKQEYCSVSELIEEILDTTGYRQELIDENTIEAQTRLENIQELVNKAVDFEQSAEQEVTLGQFLEEVALVADVDSLNDDDDKVTLMTLHGAKGLEFDKVYLCGMEDGLFPGYNSIMSDDPTDLEEERRLAYVGITRAKKELTLTAAKQRLVNGEPRFSKISRFCQEIPPFLVDSNLTKKEKDVPKKSIQGGQSASNAVGTRSYSSRSSNFRAATGSASAITASRGIMGKTFTVEKAQSLPYGVGDRVQHMKFGEGVVLEIQDGKRDFEVTVNFEKAGTKKMFASFAKLKKLG